MKNPRSVVALPEKSVHEHDTICVFVRECRVDLRLGIYNAEMDAPQPVAVHVELEAALPHHYQDTSEKKLDRVIDYEPIYSFIREDLPRMGHIYLLETVAEQIIAFCFRDPRVYKARVRLEKIGIFPAAAGAGVEVSRTRPQD